MINLSLCDVIEILGISNLSEVILNYFNLKEIPVPEGARPDGNRVYVMRDIGGGERNKLYIGIYARKDEGTFYANDNFRLFFPSLWLCGWNTMETNRYLRIFWSSGFISCLC